MPKKIATEEKPKPNRQEVAQHLKDYLQSPRLHDFLAAVEANKGRVKLDDLALRDLINLESQIPPDSQHPDAILARECCTNVRDAKNEMKAGYWLRRGMVAFKDLQLYDDAILGEKAREQQRLRKLGTGPTDHEAVRRYHGRLKKDANHDSTAQTAENFGISTRQVSRIVNTKKPGKT